MNIGEYAEFLIKSIAKDPEMIRVQTFEEDDVTILEVLVPENEMGSIIGKGGKIANSVRTLIQAYAYLNKTGRVRINIDSF